MRCGYDGLMRADGRTAAEQAVVEHITSFFADRTVEVFDVDDGPIQTRVPGFAEICVPPTASGQLWTYVSCGVWDAVHIEEHGLEFCLIAPERDHRHALILAMNAYYHANPDESFRLDVGHTVPLGEPWLPGSLLDHLLVSQPYPYGPEFEMCHWEGATLESFGCCRSPKASATSGLNTDSRRSSNASTTRASTTGIRNDRLSPNRRFARGAVAPPRAVCTVPLLAQSSTHGRGQLRASWSPVAGTPGTRVGCSPWPVAGLGSRLVHVDGRNRRAPLPLH